MDNTNLTEEAVFDGFCSGVSCAMSVFGALAPSLGLDEKTAKKIACGFGSGMCHKSVCGCVTAAMMVLGLMYGNCEPGEMEKAAQFREKKAAFEKAFSEEFGGIFCPELVDGLDLADPAQKAKAIEDGLLRDICAPAVCFTIDYLKSLLQ